MIRGLQHGCNALAHAMTDRRLLSAWRDRHVKIACLHLSQKLDPVRGMPGGDPFEQLQVGEQLV